jgi:hypothetical protein
MFQYQVAIWECNCNVWHEIFGAQNVTCPQPFHIKPWYLDVLPQIPSLVQYFRMVEDYNSRSLTYPEDVLQAFAGVATALSSVFPDGFAWGLPCHEFLSALLWVPKEPLKRRVPTDPNICLPSWIGWEGRIDADAWSEDSNTKPGDTWKSIPVAQECLVRIAGDFRASPASPMPTILQVERAEFANFKIGGPYDNVPNDGGVQILDSYNLFCGVIFRMFPVKFVAISKSYGRLTAGRYLRRSRSRVDHYSDGTCVGDYYNVLLVSWNSGVAHRVGIG